MATRTEIAKRGGARPGAGRPPTVLTDADRNLILDTYIEIPNYHKVAERLGLPRWTVWKFLAEQPSQFRFNVLQARTYDTLHGTLTAILDLLPKVQAHNVADLYRTFGALIKGLCELEGGGVVKGPKNAMQTIVNITTDEAARLKQTMDTVEGEVVDASTDV